MYIIIIVIIIIIRVVKSRRMRWSGPVAPKEVKYKQFRWRNLKEREHLEDAGVD